MTKALGQDLYPAEYDRLNLQAPLNEPNSIRFAMSQYTRTLNNKFMPNNYSIPQNLGISGKLYMTM